MTISRSVLSKYTNDGKVFVETGTHTGITTKLAADIGFQSVYTIELSHKFYKDAVDKFKNRSNIVCIQGDSTEKLKDVLKQLNEKAVFWLDGHWSMGDTAKGEKAVPIFEELEVIKTHHIKDHTILIDDLRLMGNPDEPIKDWEAISLDEVKQRCLDINPNYKFTLENGHIPNDILVARVNG